MKRLYLVRHGEAEGSGGRAVGQVDLPLSNAGRAQVEALAATWRGPSPARVFTSDLRRAVDSARILTARAGGVLAVDPRLRELSFGEWEGLRWEEIHLRYPDHLAVWGERWWEIAPPGGETFADLSRRTLTWFQDLRGGEVVVAVAHGGSLRALLAALLGLPRGEVFDLRLDCAHVSAIAVEEGNCELLYVNQSGFREP